MKLNKASRKYIEKELGMPYNEIDEKDAVTIDQDIEKRKKSKLRHSLPKSKLLSGRGTPLLYYKRFKEKEDIDQRILSITKK